MAIENGASSRYWVVGLVLILWATEANCENCYLKSSTITSDVMPALYRLWMKIDTDTNTYQGEVEIQMEVMKKGFEGNALYLHADPKIKIEQISFKNFADDNSIYESKGYEICQDDKHQVLIIFLPKTYRWLRYPIVRIKFSSEIRNDRTGLYYLIEEDGGKIVVPNLKNKGSRLVFPSFDQSDFPAYFDLTLRVKRDSIAKSLMQIESISQADDETDYIDVNFARTNPILPHNMGFLVIANSNIRMLRHGPGPKIGQQVSVYGKPIRRVFGVNLISQIWSVAAKNLQVNYMPDKIDVFFMTSLEKLEMIDFPGLVIIGWDLLFSKTIQRKFVPKFLKAIYRHLIETFMPLNLPEDNWFLEGFAQFLTLSTVYNFSLSSYVEEYLTKMNPYALDHYALTMYPQISDEYDMKHEWKENEELREVTDIKLYNIFRQIELHCGVTDGRSALRSLLVRESREFELRYRGDIELPNLRANVLKKIQTNCALDIEGLLQTWLTIPGIPLIEVDFNGSTRQLLIRQRVFMSDAPNNGKSKTVGWHLILEYNLYNDSHSLIKGSLKTSAHTNRDYKIQLPVGFNLELRNNYIKLNSKHFGFYRIKYNSKIFTNGLCQVITNTKEFNHAERYGLVDDAWTLFKAGEVTADYLLDIIHCHANKKLKDMSCVVVSAIIDILLPFRDTNLEQMLQKFARHFLSAQLNIGLFKGRTYCFFGLRMYKASVPELLIRFDNKKAIDIGFEYFKENGLLRINHQSIPAVLMAVAKSNAIELLTKLYNENVALQGFISRALGTATSGSILEDAWKFLQLNKNSSHILDFLLETLTTENGRVFIYKLFLKEPGLENLLEDKLSREDGIKLIQEFFLLFHRFDMNYFQATLVRIYGQDWDQIKLEIHKRRQHYHKLRALNENKLHEFLSKYIKYNMRHNAD